MRHKTQMGFSIVEFIVAMAVLTLLFAAVMSLFIPLLKHTKAQSGIVQSQIEGIVGLEMLRTDIVHAGHGLPWNMNGLAYLEAAASETVAVTLNDASNAPRGIATINNTAANNPDYLAIKGNNMTLEQVAQKVSYIQRGDLAVHQWGDASRDFDGTDHIALLRLVDPTTGVPLSLLPNPTDPSTFNMQVGEVPAPSAGGFANEMYFVFGLTDSGTTPRMPFNRADYFISHDPALVASRCVAGTGTLVKSLVSQADGTLVGNYPILDCVADFQIALGVDTDTIPNNTIDCVTNDIASLGTLDVSPINVARTVRDRVREVRVYVLVQEGNFDRDYIFTRFDSGTSVQVGEPNALTCNPPDDNTLGENFNMTSISGYEHYRWKVYRFTVHPENLTYSLIGRAKGAR